MLAIPNLSEFSQDIPEAITDWHYWRAREHWSNLGRLRRLWLPGSTLLVARVEKALFFKSSRHCPRKFRFV
jgi:hypothetical protein